VFSGASSWRHGGASTKDVCESINDTHSMTLSAALVAWTLAVHSVGIPCFKHICNATPDVHGRTSNWNRNA
jgi:hypothetical protein